MKDASCIDEPQENATVQRHGFVLSGWFISSLGRRIVAVEVTAEGQRLGSTRWLYPRPDVDRVLEASAGDSSGFVVDCALPLGLRTRSPLALTVEAVDEGGGRIPLGLRSVRLSTHDYRNSYHGYVFEPGFETVVARDQIYASGPASPLADTICADLIFRYVDSTARVLDVGCGIGAYGHVFRDHGRPWTGCEIRSDHVAAACAAGLDVRLVENGLLPFADGSFDAALAVEVIEHAEDLHGLLKEIKRVAPRMALVSVPNFEVIPVTAMFYALPWHMLEPDHRNFFAHGSLAATLRTYYDHVEVFEYGKLQLLRALDGVPLNNHLFAVAWSDA